MGPLEECVAGAEDLIAEDRVLDLLWVFLLLTTNLCVEGKTLLLFPASVFDLSTFQYVHEVLHPCVQFAVLFLECFVLVFGSCGLAYQLGGDRWSQQACT